MAGEPLNEDTRLIGGPSGLAGNFFFFIVPYVFVVWTLHYPKKRSTIPTLFWACVIWEFLGRMSYANNPPSLVLGTFIAGFYCL